MRKLLLSLLLLPSLLLGIGVQYDVAVEDVFGKNMGFKANYVSALFAATTPLGSMPFCPFVQSRLNYFPSKDWYGANLLTGVSFGDPCDVTPSRLYMSMDYLHRVDDFYQIAFGMIFPTPFGTIFAEFNQPFSLERLFEVDYYNDYIGDYYFSGKTHFVPCQVFYFGLENKMCLFPWMTGEGRFEGYYFKNSMRASVWGGAITLRTYICGHSSVFVRGGYDKVFGKTLIGGLQIDLYRAFSYPEEENSYPYPWVERNPIPVLDHRYSWETNY